MKKIQMVDLTTQYVAIQAEMDAAVLEVLRSGGYINGEAVASFGEALSRYTGASFVVPCANGTDALQIALMSLNLQAGDEVIVPDFTYAAAAEAVLLLGLIPVFVDVDPHTFNLDVDQLPDAISTRTRAIIPVHLFGQACSMEEICLFGKKHGLTIIEDNAQSIGATYRFSDNSRKQTGTIGQIGTLSFFPSKNLGCYGDGGALLTQDEDIAERLKMLASHGQRKKYKHELVGCNSRLDTLQAAILNVKLKYLNQYIEKRQLAASYYRKQISHPLIELPEASPFSTHTYHQFTIKVKNGERDKLQEYLKKNGIPSMIYYPLPLHDQPAFHQGRVVGELKNATNLSREVLSLPMHTELDQEQLDYIIEKINRYE